jgi:hypothetical protein
MKKPVVRRDRKKLIHPTINQYNSQDNCFHRSDLILRRNPYSI